MKAMIDLDVTWRSPPAPDDESAAALVDAARAGGIGVVVVGVAGPDDVGAARAAAGALSGAGAKAGVVVVPAFSPSVGDGLADLYALAEVSVSVSAINAGRVVWRMRRPTNDALLLRRLGDLARAHDAVVMVPALDAGLADDAVAFEGPVATRFGLKGMPEAAEAIGVARVLEIAALTGGRFHLTGLATARGVAMLEGGGVDVVTGSVNAVHLLLDDEAWARRPYDGRLLQRPPLPTAASRQALVDAVTRGVVMVASGHRAVRKRERDLEIGKASAGGTALRSAFHMLRERFGDDVVDVAARVAPARVLGVAVPPTESAGTVVDVDDDLRVLVKECS